MILQKTSGLIKGIVAFLLVTMSLFHIFFSPKPQNIIELKNEYKKVIKKRNNQQSEYLESLIKGELTKEAYYSKVKKLLINSSSKVKNINKEKHLINYKFSFRGRSSFRLWIYMFGLVTLGFFFSCKSLYHDIVNGSTFKFQLISLVGIVVSFFWLIHLTFLTQKDFSESKYITLIIICAALATAFTYYLMKYYTYKDAIILKLLSFLKRVKNKHYKDMAVRAVYSEETGTTLATEKTTNEAMEEFDKDLVTTIKGL
ncbi:hypothetical protein [Tenacibaculum sp. 190524A02b]|uniref:hypothetical protein n=1 Tax=Tenacibaculum vairaonense TaxID=3137860 RepID=UPI0031FAF18A